MHRVETKLGGRTFSLETGELAGQADGAVVARYGDTTLLATVVAAGPRQGLDFFPLQVEFEERAYSIGRIPGSVFRREGRPPLSGILAGRLADRSIRPLFPDGMRNDTQIVLTLLTHDGENEPDVMGIVAASAVVTLAGLPFDGPVGALRVGLDGDDFVVNPPADLEGPAPALDLVVAGTGEGVVMLEAGAQVVADDTVVRAINWGQEQLQCLIDIQTQLKDLAGKPTREVTISKPAAELQEAIANGYGSRINDAVRLMDQAERKQQLGAIAEDAATALGEAHDAGAIGDAVHDVESEAVRALILNEGIRPDGRGESALRAALGARGRAAAHPRHGPVSARRDPSAFGHYARHAARRPAHRADGLGSPRAAQALHPSLQHAALCQRRDRPAGVAAPPRDRPWSAGGARHRARAA